MNLRDRRVSVGRLSRVLNKHYKDSCQLVAIVVDPSINVITIVINKWIMRMLPDFSTPRTTHATRSLRRLYLLKRIGQVMNLKLLFFLEVTLRISLSSGGRICPDAATECAEISLDETTTPTTNLEELESKISRIERRLRAVEQPVWQISGRPDDWEVCAEGPCRCRPETRSISCWGRNFLDVPPTQLVPNDLLKDLGSNQLTALHRDTFLDLTQLLHLDLSDNQIEHLPLNLFFSLHAVTHLRLSRNLLRELHQNQLLRMRRLHILDFSSNKLSTLPAALFLTTTTLAILDLSSNRISTLPSGVFNGLRELEELLLINNLLSTLPGSILHDLSNLVSLRLEENKLQDLPTEFFTAQLHLTELNLRGNQFTRIKNGLFEPLANLLVLELSANRIAHIDLKAFEGLISLKELQLGHNSLKSITPGLFLPVRSLERLVLYANSLISLDAGAFKGLSNLTILLLHANHLKNVHSDLLKDTPSLRKLQLEANHLSYLPSRFLDVIPNIRQLRLERNPWHCDCGAAYLAGWLRKRYLATPRGYSVSSNKSSFWDYGAGAVCRGPGALGGRLLVQLSFHELCEGQWASMRGLVPRLPVEPPTTTLPSTIQH
ncbi:leucine-rich repeat-containing protein 15-like isoform X2 [Athalia rosae]|uniref:leucine-rich repeat-containing protein 15-like isoform X2 n=1 Tax=Athalia rosae TaxID=37344 RepID=UPI0020336C76|nr:leucine-rich repeat-containing protein 15-like isoform X2 [Athalia rosae]